MHTMFHFFAGRPFLLLWCVLPLVIFASASQAQITIDVYSTSPDQNELDVAISTDITVVFSDDIDETSVDNTTFLVYAQSTGLHDGVYNVSDETVTLNPDIDFAEGEIVTVVLTDGIHSTMGIALVSGYTWSFTIIAQTGTAIILPPEYLFRTHDDPASVVAADVDNDGDLDLAVANAGSNNVIVHDNHGKFNFDFGSDFSVGDSPRSVIAADFDRDGCIDLATANADSDDISILRNDQTGDFDPYTSYLVGERPFAVCALDLENDGDLDLAVACRTNDQVVILMNDGSGAFVNVGFFTVGDLPSGIFAADLDRDADMDLVTANFNSDDVTVLLNDGNGDFSAAITNYPVGENPRSVFAAGLNGDSDIDLIAANWGTDNVSVLLNNSDGTFATHSVHQVKQRAQSVFAADLDADGDLDLAVANGGYNSLSILLNAGDATFAPYLPYDVDYNPVSVFAADLDDDGDLDLATANWSSDDISVFENCGAGPGDVDGDALPDTWERCGYDPDKDGIIDVDLPGMGAKHRHKDVFVEVDWMEAGSGESESHFFKDEARELVVAMFADAPVSNPGGIDGIDIHIDVGQGDPFSGGNEITHDDNLDPVWTEFDLIKDNNFDPIRAPIFHYCIFAHKYSGGSSSGLSRGIGASDLIVSLGGWSSNPGTIYQQAGTFAHELGHNLGLRHGGDENTNRKPNFLSIMSYDFQTTGLIINGMNGNFDYSRWDLPDLDENDLDEQVGLDGPVAVDDYGTVYWNKPGAKCERRDADQVNDPIDWDGDGSIEQTGVAHDIGGFGRRADKCKGTKTVLGGAEDWTNLDLSGLPAPGPLSYPRVPWTQEEEEFSFEDYLELAIWPGDMDDNKVYEEFDVVALLEYICQGGEEPQPMYRADAHCDQKIDLMDIVVLINHVFRSGAYPCAHIHEATDPGSPDILRIDSVGVNDVSSELTVDVPVYLTWDEGNIPGITVPIWVMSDDVDLDTAILTGGFAGGAEYGGFTRHPTESNQGLIWACETVGNFIDDGTEKLFATLKITIPAGTAAQSVVIDSVTVPPANGLLLGDDQGYSWTPEFVSGMIDISGSDCDCGIWGDVNNDDEINPIDVVYMVNFVYKNYDLRIQPPECPYEAGDVTCDQAVNPVDVVHYVNYVYKNITPWPCEDPCAQ